MPLAPELEPLAEASRAIEGHEAEFHRPEVLRASYRDLSAGGAGPRPDVDHVADRVIDGPGGDLHLRIYRHGDPGGPLVVHFHGGGWVIGDLDSHDVNCRQIVTRTGGTVVSVDYRLAPEHPYPAAADDAYAATVWASEHAGELRADGERLFVVGDSAGGNLAASVVLQSRDKGGPAVAGQVLVYPVTSFREDWPSFEENGRGYYLTVPTMHWFHQCYLGADDPEHASAATDPYAAPLEATSLEGVAPALVMTAEYDPLRDEGRAYAERLSEAGVTIDYIEYPGMMHGFVNMGAFTPVAYSAFDEMGRFILRG